MHLLDRIAAFAIVLQLVAVLVFGWIFFGKLEAIQASIQTTSVRVVSIPTITEVPLTPTPSVAAFYYKPATTSGVVRPSK